MSELGYLKDCTQAAEADQFDVETLQKGVCIEVENYYGSTIRGFLVVCSNNGYSIVDTTTDDEDNSEDLADYGIKIEVQGSEIKVYYLTEYLGLADTDGDYLFESEYTLIRLQDEREPDDDDEDDDIE